MCSGSEEGSYLRLIDVCITQHTAQGPSKTCNASKEEEGASGRGGVHCGRRMRLCSLRLPTSSRPAAPHACLPPWRQPRCKSMVSLVNSHTNATSKRWHLWEIDLRFPPRLPPGRSSKQVRHESESPANTGSQSAVEDDSQKCAVVPRRARI